jgi:hypothetical protein
VALVEIPQMEIWRGRIRRHIAQFLDTGRFLAICGGFLRALTYAQRLPEDPGATIQNLTHSREYDISC